MSILVIAEHNNIEVKTSTLNTISAASKLGGEIEVLVLGSNIDNISKEISSYQHVSKVIFIDCLAFKINFQLRYFFAFVISMAKLLAS